MKAIISIKTKIKLVDTEKQRQPNLNILKVRRRRKEKWTSKKGNEDEYEKGGDEGVLDSSDENGEGDEEELPQHLRARPCQHPAQCHRQYVIRVRVQQIPPLHIQCRPSPILFLRFLSSSIFNPLLFSSCLPLSVPPPRLRLQFPWDAGTKVK